MTSYMNAAFDVVAGCKDCTERSVSLYERTSKYGGPEEGGWWRHDVVLVKTMRVPSQSAADAAYKRICNLAKAMADDAKQRWSERCSSEVDWCEARGLDADFLPEPDGPSDFFVVIEDTAGSLAAVAPAHYE